MGRLELISTKLRMQKCNSCALELQVSTYLPPHYMAKGSWQDFIRRYIQDMAERNPAGLDFAHFGRKLFSYFRRATEEGLVHTKAKPSVHTSPQLPPGPKIQIKMRVKKGKKWKTTRKTVLVAVATNPPNPVSVSLSCPYQLYQISQALRSLRETTDSQKKV